MSQDALLLLAIGSVLTGAAMAPFLLRMRRAERASARRAEEALRDGLDRPGTLHPVVDTDRCIGSAGCVAVCPEQVLGIRNGQAVALAAAACIGHGLCERACPTEAIRLVFGTAERGVDIPRIRENFETNVPGLYIVGELGGMGLIRNAFEQGRQCIDGIAAERRSVPAGIPDLLIVGCGPAGLSAALHAADRGLRYVVLEREDVGGTVRHYPRKKVVMTAPVDVPGYGRLAFREIRKEELVDLWRDVVARTGLEVRTGESVTAIRPVEDGTFVVRSDVGEYRAARVVLAIGRRGTPRKLGIPGEASAAVAYALQEPEAFRGDRAMVVGGGDSAVEAALALAEQPGTRTWLAYRGARLSRVKPKNRERFERAVAAGAVEPLWETELTEVAEGQVACRRGDGTATTLPAERVFIFIGGELPTGMLREAGVEIETKFGTP